MAELKWTTEALDWLEEIYRYIAQDNSTAAAQVVDGIFEKAQILTRHPDIGTRLRQVEEGDVRFILYGHYRIAYLRHANDELIHVIGVFHGALDIDKYLP
jgi:plasmid stabilization system protein ParE